MLASITRLDMKNRFELQANCAAGIALSLRFEIYQPPRYKRFATHNFNKVAHFSKMNLIVFFFLAILALVTIQLLIFCIFIFYYFFCRKTCPYTHKYIQLESGNITETQANNRQFEFEVRV